MIPRGGSEGGSDSAALAGIDAMTDPRMASEATEAIFPLVEEADFGIRLD